MDHYLHAVSEEELCNYGSTICSMCAVAFPYTSKQ